MEYPSAEAMLCDSHQMTTELQWFMTAKVYRSSSYLSQTAYVHAILIQRPKDLAGLLEGNKSKWGVGAVHGDCCFVWEVHM